MTPLLLIFALRAKALDIIDFFRNFSVEVVGVGDICSFAQLDIRNHGNPQVRADASVVGKALMLWLLCEGCPSPCSTHLTCQSVC